MYQLTIKFEELPENYEKHLINIGLYQMPSYRKRNFQNASLMEKMDI